MDSHVSRRIGFELAAHLLGARIETVYHPTPSVFVFKISKPALRPYLIVQSHREAACILPSLKKPDNPPYPDALTMRLRKYLCGRKIQGIWLNWSQNSIFLGLAPIKNLTGGDKGYSPDKQAEIGEESLFLRLNLKLGPSLCSLLPESSEGLTHSPRHQWDIKDALSSLSWQESDLSKPWDKFPYLTPLLRKTLTSMNDKGAQLALLADLESGQGDFFAYVPKDASLPLFSAWPLPPFLRPQNSTERVFEFALEALEECASAPLFAQITAAKAKSIRLDIKREKKRISRAFAKLEQEEQRLHELIRLKEKALLIQAQLYSLDKQAKFTELALTKPNGQKELIVLDSQKTLHENMESMFKKAARAVRGFPHIERRRTELKELLNKLENAAPELSELNARSALATRTAHKNEGLPASQTNSQVSQYLSPSGLTVLRGKNTKGNREALKMASPYDLWLHAEGGPSAHVIIKLPHAAYNLPEADLEMAALLVAEKSWQRNDRHATIICALAKDVHPIKGGPHGTVRVKKIFRTITASQTYS